MKNRIVTLFFALCFLSVGVAQNAHFYLKDSVQLSLDLSVIDSITYLKPSAEVNLPASCTLVAGSNAKLTYMVSDGLQDSPIEWHSTDSRVAYFYEDYLYARKAGKCIISATYKGVTSSCVVTVTPSATNDFCTLLSYTSLACYSAAEIGVYMSQALTTGNKSQTGFYPYRAGWDFISFSNPYWHWYSTEMASTAVRLTAEAEAKNYKNVELIARTLTLLSTMLVTDIHGDIPLRELGLVVNPKYETQQDIYDWMFMEVDELLGYYNDSEWVNCSTNMPLDYTMDRIYGGDLTKWEAFCKGLKARLWLRKLPNWENTKSTCNKIISMVDDALVGWTAPLYYYYGGKVEEMCPWGPYAPSVGGLTANRLDESIPTTFFLHGILGSIDGTYQITRGYALDPRAEKIMQPRGDLKKGMLHLESNIGMDPSNLINDYPNLLSNYNPYTQNTGYISLMTTEELMFIKAEAQYWAGDIEGAYVTTVEAIKKNMERYGIKESELSGNELNQYNRFFEIKLNKYNFTIADLMQQKYVAMYLQPEQWTDMRRYNYSSSENGIAYVLSGQKPVYVYDVKNVHNGRNAMFSTDAANFCLEYSLGRPYNLYDYWLTEEDYGINAKLSPNAWVARLMPAPNMFNKSELRRLGYINEDGTGNPSIFKKRMIWAQKNNSVVICADENIEWK